ncbi:hypothetical protein ACOCJ5_07705 [Knoellia sp. CPCC 206450]|uniref:hypothetical protein n=1 Tax=Knoellia tibetensis TaxID=3404798 RepID=UPI003B4280C8
MGRIKGHYEWDDDDLTPGHKKEGGLHQNLFDDDGKLKGSARFIPDTGSDPEPWIVTETVYVPVDERRLSREQEQLQEVINAIVAQLVHVGITKGLPLAEQWWQQTARPAIHAKRAAMHERRSLRRAKRSGVVSGSIVERSAEVEDAAAETRPSMSNAEAQARLLAAMAAKAYSDEQVRLVNNSDIVDGEGGAELNHSLGRLPADQIGHLIEQMVKNPEMLADANLADLASVLGRRAVEERTLVRARRDRKSNLRNEAHHGDPTATGRHNQV